MSTQPSSEGFFAALFDLSFESFISTRLVRVIYVIGLVLMGLAALMALVGGLSQGAGSALLMLIVAPALFLFGAMYLRVMLEVLIVVFRIAENVGHIAHRSSVSEAGASRERVP